MSDSSDELSYSGHILVLTSAAAIIGCIVWANWAEVDQITRAQGQVIASSRNQVIQELDGGIVEAILVKEGSVVKKDRPWSVSTSQKLNPLPRKPGRGGMLRPLRA